MDKQSGRRWKRRPGVPIGLRAEVEVVHDPELARRQVRALRNFLLAVRSRAGDFESYAAVGDETPRSDGLDGLMGPLEASVVRVGLGGRGSRVRSTSPLGAERCPTGAPFIHDGLDRDGSDWQTRVRSQGPERGVRIATMPWPPMRRASPSHGSSPVRRGRHPAIRCAGAPGAEAPVRAGTVLDLLLTSGAGAESTSHQQCGASLSPKTNRCVCHFDSGLTPLRLNESSAARASNRSPVSALWNV